MNKRENWNMIILFLAGCILAAAGIIMDIDYYSSIMVGCGAGMSLNCVGNWIRNYYHNKPENREAYEKKKKLQDIDLKDERKIYIRYKSGYIAWNAFMVLYFIAAFVLSLLKVNYLIICFCFAMAVVHYLVATVIYKHLCRKM